MPSPEWPDELAYQVGLAIGAALDVAARYTNAGFAVVIDDFLDPHQLAEYHGLNGEAHRIILCPSRDEAHRRNSARYGDIDFRDYIDTGIGHIYGLLPAAIDALRSNGWIVLDTTNMTFEETVAAILAE